jgi:hypothetical protein
MAEILVRPGDRRKLMDTFKTNYPTVRSALRYRTNTLLAQRIRAAALEMGGAERNGERNGK